MSYRVFDVATMIAISDPWVDDRRDKALLVSMPLTAGLVPILVSAHNGLLQIRLVASEDEAIARVLAEQALTLDSEHDELYRSLYAIVTGWAAVSSSETRRNMLEKLRDTLFPEGPAGTQRSYLAEAGNVELALSKLTPEIEETLNSIIVDGRSVFQIFNEWVEVGRKLGEVERERATLRKEVERRRHRQGCAECAILVDSRGQRPLGLTRSGVGSFQ